MLHNLMMTVVRWPLLSWHQPREDGFGRQYRGASGSTSRVRMRLGVLSAPLTRAVCGSNTTPVTLLSGRRAGCLLSQQHVPLSRDSARSSAHSPSAVIAWTRWPQAQYSWNNLLCKLHKKNWARITKCKAGTFNKISYLFSIGTIKKNSSNQRFKVSIVFIQSLSISCLFMCETNNKSNVIWHSIPYFLAV